MIERFLASIACACAVLGCDDPSLRVVVERPAAYAKLVERVEISVYERADLTCDDIAFDKLSADELRASLRSSGTDDLDAIPRLGHKAVVARGYGRAGKPEPEDRLILAGCTEIDEIGDGERVTIATEPVATAAIDSAPMAVGKGAIEVAVVAVDANLEGIDGKEVRWSTYGPSGSFPASGDIDEPSTSTILRGGEGQVRPTPPGLIGPYAVQMRIKWSDGLPPPINATMAELPTQRSLGLPDPAFLNACTIYTRDNLPALACLEKDSLASRFVRSYRLIGGVLTQVAAPVSMPSAIGVYGAGAGVIVVNSDGSIAGILGASVSGTVCQGSCAGVTIVDVLGFQSCGAAGTAGLFAYTREGLSPRLVATVASTGEKYAFPNPPFDPTMTLGSVGCVTDLEIGGAPRIAATVNTSMRSAIYLVGVPAPVERIRNGRQAGSGFTVSGKEQRLLTTEGDPTGLVVVESVLNKPANTYRLFERRRSPAVAAARHYISGNFDLDDEADLAWDVLDDAEAQTRVIQMLLAARPGRPALVGRLPLADTADLLTADLDGDGISELIGYSGNSVSIQRLGTLR
jgi:hypothetical protein